jgi:hypothetical protein
VRRNWCSLVGRGRCGYHQYYSLVSTV